MKNHRPLVSKTLEKAKGGQPFWTQTLEVFGKLAETAKLLLELQFLGKFLGKILPQKLETRNFPKIETFLEKFCPIFYT